MVTLASIYCGLLHPMCCCCLQADAFRDENNKRRKLERQLDMLCQQVGRQGLAGHASLPRSALLHLADCEAGPIELYTCRPLFRTTVLLHDLP